jgi:hypothetical protein
MTLASTVRILPSSTRTREIMETLVATRADATTMLLMGVKPGSADVAYPKKEGHYDAHSSRHEGG